MSKLEERENRRKVSAVGKIIEGSKVAPATADRGRPKEENRELKKRISLSVLPSLYEDIQKIAYVQRRSTSDLVDGMFKKYRADHEDALKEFETIRK